MEREKSYSGQLGFTFNVVKRRAGRAPKGSGVPVGTKYHWYILAHQHVEKLNANDYKTEMSGMKFSSTIKWQVKRNGV